MKGDKGEKKWDCNSIITKIFWKNFPTNKSSEPKKKKKVI